MIRWSFRTSNLELQIGASNGIAYQNYKKRALRIMTNSGYNAHTEPLFKQLYLLKVKDIFDVQCMKFWYKFVNKKLPNYFRDMFIWLTERRYSEINLWNDEVLRKDNWRITWRAIRNNYTWCIILWSTLYFVPWRHTPNKTKHRLPHFAIAEDDLS